jgi:glucose/arabinose dehydrogenase
MRVNHVFASLGLLLCACHVSGRGTPDSAVANSACSLPGSTVHSGGTITHVPGGPPAPNLDWLTVPDGFCVHYFGNVGNARQLRFAPGGELFVASPTTATTGDGPNGRAAIVVLPDDNHDGVADGTLTFLANLPSTQGLLFNAGYFYYQDGTTIRRMAYRSGQRQGGSGGDVIADIKVYVSQLHWPKVFDVARDGTIFVTNGGDQDESCDPARPFHGGIVKLDGNGGVIEVAKGFRNPIALRCSPGHDCFAAELSLDYSAAQGGREKIMPIRAGDDWGFPCCATKNLPYQNLTPVPDCSKIVAESLAFIIGETPFALEFDLGQWPAPYTHDLFVTLHGDFGSWVGARLVAIPTDSATGAPLAASDLDGSGPKSFAAGWDDGKQDHGRPAALAMSPDGRLFLSNDMNGDIVWIAPLSSTSG